jgi:putative ABC transport system permease protein
VDSGAQLLERTNSFRVRGIVPMTGIYADRTLMPDFPGVAKAESTHDWEGFPLRYKIRDKDEAYWNQYRGTPKAFITLAAGQAMWASRFGSLTAVRYPVPTNMTAEVCRDVVYRNLIANLKPSDVGLRVEPVRMQALKAAEQSQDFGQLFLGFSFFLIIAALLLMALLFQFGLEQRAREIGTFLALGFTPKQVRRLLLWEGAALALAGGVLGAVGGLGFAAAMIWGLKTVWRDAVGESALQFHASLTTLLVGILASTVVATLTIWLTVRKKARQPAAMLLAGESGNLKSEIRNPKEGRNPKSEVRSRGVWIAIGAGGAAALLVGWTLIRGDTSNAGAFFGAGALLLTAGLAAVSAWLKRLAFFGTQSESSDLEPSDFGFRTLSIRSCARRSSRSLATVALLACGCFVIVSIGVFHVDAARDASRRTSGTGGFALLGETTMPVGQDLNTRAGQESFGLDSRELAGVSVVQFRLREGDEASCLNLNRAQKPRLLGVRPETLAGRFTFSNVASGSREKGWELLRAGSADEVPAIGDANSIQWALGKKIGDTIDYTDERGRTFKLRLVGAVANSILQGNLIIDEAAFTSKFPSESGYRVFLLDAPSNSVTQVSTMLTRALQDVGLELTPATQRLNAFNAVQNTYLGTFQVLGGLGLLLGSAGLGVVVLRNVLERRSELGVFVAVGFRRRTLNWLILWEHGALLALGLLIGILAAVVAVLPAVLTPGTPLPYKSLGVTLGLVLLNGLAWAWLATRFALRGDLLASLRDE